MIVAAIAAARRASGSGRRARRRHRLRHGRAVRPAGRARPRAHAGARRDRHAGRLRARAAPAARAPRRAQHGAATAWLRAVDRASRSALTMARRRRRRARRPHRRPDLAAAARDWPTRAATAATSSTSTLVDMRGWDTMGEIIGPHRRRHRRREPHLPQPPRPTTCRGVAAPRGASASMRGSGRHRAARPRADAASGRAAQPWLLAGRTLAAGEPLDPARGRRAAAVPPDHRRLGLPALRRAQRPGRRLRRRPRRRARARRPLPRRRPLRARAPPRRSTPASCSAPGLVLAAGTALVPLFFGADALTSTWFEAESRCVRSRRVRHLHPLRHRRLPGRRRPRARRAAQPRRRGRPAAGGRATTATSGAATSTGPRRRSR